MTPANDTPTTHYDHSRAMEAAPGLPGAMPRPIKVTMLGAGSGFTLSLLNDVLQIPGLRGLTLALVDVDPGRLEVMEALVGLMVEQSGRKDVKVAASTDRRKLLKGSDYLINCIEVSGVRCVAHDYEIPLSFGVDQCIGDTIGPGGLFKALRTIPEWLAILRDAERLCPRALILNYTNPMGMMCHAAALTSRMAVVGLCHSVQGTSHLLAQRARVPFEAMRWECAGINHLAWFTRLEHQGEDLYPKLIRKARRDLAGKPADPEDAGDLVRKDMMVQFGAFITESSGHLSEYLPYYRKRKDLIKTYCREKYEGESGFYATQWPRWRKDADKQRKRMLRVREPLLKDRTWEYASWIIEAVEKNAPIKIYGNVPNQLRGRGALIENLPEGCVEVACLVDANGIQPIRYGRLPEAMAAICASNMPMINLAARAAVERSRELALHALMLDPLSAAVCSPGEIRRMGEALFKAERRYLGGYQ